MSKRNGHHGEIAIEQILAVPVPPGWAGTTIASIGEVRLGRQRSPKNRSADYPTKYLRAANLTWSGLSLQDVLEMNFRPEERTAYRLLPGDVLLSEASGSATEVGKPAIWNGEIEDCCFQNTVIRFRSKVVDSKFALITFQHFARNGVFSRVARGVGIHHLSADRFASMPFLLPPHGEQGRIVAKVEELFSDLDAGVAALERAKAKLKRYRASVLKAAVDGSLTAEWREKHPATEPAQKLLARILKERRRKWEEAQLAKFAAAGREPPKNWKSKYVEPTPPDTTNLPDLPEGWCWASVEQIGDVQLGRQRSPKNRSRNYPTKYVRAANLTENGLDLSDVLDMEFLPSAIDRYRLAEGDILLSEASGSPDQVGKPAVWNNEIEECCFQNTVIRLRPAQMSHQFLLAVFQHFYFNKVFAGIAAGVGINHLSAAKFSRITIPLPPFEEQEVIGIEVAERLSQIQAADIAIGHGLKRAARLRQSILKQAFEGKLVAQDPADEPASALLARSQETRPARTTKGKAKTAKGPKKKEPKGPFFRQAAVVSYAVRRLVPCKSFGRTQLEKTLHLAQSHLGIDLGFEFVRQAAGPFDKAIYAIEGAAKKNDWFATQDRKTFGVRYQPGAKIDAMCQYAEKYLGTSHAAFDQLLDHISKMNTDQAELFATTYAAWNDLLLDGRPASDDTIVKEVHGWHEKKKRFDQEKIRKCLTWMREHGYVPTGQGQRTLVAVKKRRSPARKT